MSQLGKSTSRGHCAGTRAVRIAAVILVGATGLAACGSGSSGSGGSSAGKKVTLTVWQDGNLQDTGFGFMKQVATNFEQAHPGVKVQIVEKPPDNYFALLHTALISKTAPDVADVYAGSYLTNLEPYLLNLNKYISASTRSAITGVQYYSKDGDTTKATYGIPSEDQFYNMWYNKALFAKAGIKAPPTDFAEMESDCRALRAKGITPFADGSPTFTTPGSGAVQDWSYLAGAVYSLQQWNSILDGTTPYDSAALVKEITDWAGVYKAGCTSSSVTTQSTDALFTSGKVAMVMNFNGLYPTYNKALGSKLGVMIPPWSETPQKMMVQLPGAGYTVAGDSPNAKLAAEFVASTVSTESQQLEAAGGGIPVVSSVAPKGVPKQLVALAHSGKYQLYPMFDNYMQPEVVAQIDNQLPQAFIGKVSPQSALSTLEQALKSLPSSERDVHYNLGAS
jgi:raffinose/stachyose/melibiose transport system substrate-binding protein